MTDFEKFIELLNSFGIYYQTEETNGTPKMVLVYLTENFYNLPEFWNKEHPKLAENEDDRKVVSYSGFYCWWSFYSETGKFDQVGIFE